MSSRWSALVGCDAALQQAGMTRASSVELAAAVSNSGGLGMLAPGRMGAAVVARQIDDVRALTDRPVGCTFIVRFADPEGVEVAASRLGIVDFFYDWPDERWIVPGAVCGWQIGTVDEAKAAVDVGCRYVIAQGLEAGGHVRGSTPLRELLPRVLAAVDVPVVAAGGIGTRADVDAAFALGADAVRVGTRFLAAAEADVHDDYLSALIGASADDAVLTDIFDIGWPEAPVRVLSSSVVAALTSTADVVAHVPQADGTVAAIPRRGTTPPTRATTGDIAAMALYAGRSVGAVTRRQPAAEIVAELIG